LYRKFNLFLELYEQMVNLEIIGLFLAVLIGISLGLMGGGGSILTVPLLVYFFHVNPFLASTYSLLIVGFSSLLGAIPYIKNNEYHIPAIVQMGIPSVIVVYITKYFLVPLIPEKVFISGNLGVNSDQLLLVFFSLLLIVAAFAMIRKTEIKPHKKVSVIKLISQGILIGFLTGLVGVGGGFLIIPVLVFVCEIPMKKAVGSSLIIIVLNTIIGLVAVNDFASFDQLLLVKISVLSILGIVIGTLLSKRIEGSKLKKGFGWFILVMGLTILFKEILPCF
jgi:uncharacterized membrane protein YfcA